MTDKKQEPEQTAPAPTNSSGVTLKGDPLNAHNALQLLGRVNLTGDEVPAFNQAALMLQGIREGTLIVRSAPVRKSKPKPARK